MSFTLDDLKYAADEVLLTVQNVYQRYIGDAEIVVDDVAVVGEIVADTRQAKAMIETEDPATAKLIRDYLKPVKRGGNSSLIGFIAKDVSSSTGIIAFRGTMKGSEWLDNFDFLHTQFNFGNGSAKVHKGFLKVWQLAAPSLMPQLALLAGMRRIIVTGHSLGAAVATLCALNLKGNGSFANVRCWTYASPRVFFLSSKLFDGNIAQSLRVSNASDIVTHSPPVLMGYRHVTGGLAIKPKLKDFHSLLLTYRPGLQALIADGKPRLFASEEVAFATVQAKLAAADQPKPAAKRATASKTKSKRKLMPTR